LGKGQGNETEYDAEKFIETADIPEDIEEAVGFPVYLHAILLKMEVHLEEGVFIRISVP